MTPASCPRSRASFFAFDRLLKPGGICPTRLEFLHGLVTAHGITAILRAFRPRGDFPEPGHALWSLCREKDMANEAGSLEHVVVISRPFAIAALAGARQRQCTMSLTVRPGADASAARGRSGPPRSGRKYGPSGSEIHHRDYKITGARVLPNIQLRTVNCCADLLEDFVGGDDEPGRDRKPQRLGRLEIDEHLDL